MKKRKEKGGKKKKWVKYVNELDFSYWKEFFDSVQRRLAVEDKADVRHLRREKQGAHGQSYLCSQLAVEAALSLARTGNKIFSGAEKWDNPPISRSPWSGGADDKQTAAQTNFKTQSTIHRWICTQRELQQHEQLSLGTRAVLLVSSIVFTVHKSLWTIVFISETIFFLSGLSPTPK